MNMVDRNMIEIGRDSHHRVVMFVTSIKCFSVVKVDKRLNVNTFDKEYCFIYENDEDLENEYNRLKRLLKVS